MKKQIQKFEQLNEETDKKILDMLKSESIIRNEHLVLCQQLGIPGKNIKVELLEKLQELPEINKKITNSIPLLEKAINLYIEFTGQQDYLPVVKHVLKNGNSTVFQYLYNEKPLSIEVPIVHYNLEDNNTNENCVILL